MKSAPHPVLYFMFVTYDSVLAVVIRTTKARECPYGILLPFRL